MHKTVGRQKRNGLALHLGLITQIDEKIKEFDFIDTRERVRGSESGGYLKVGALDREKHLA